MRTWLLAASPSVFPIDAIVATRAEDTFNVANSRPESGDRAVIWRREGVEPAAVVAFAEITSPAEIIDASDDEWLRAGPHAGPRPRVRLRYLLSPELPMVIDGPHASLLNRVGVKGQRVARLISRDLFDDLVEAAGGWTALTPPPGESVASDLLATGDLARRLSGPERKAVEERAMAVAFDELQAAGWTEITRTAEREAWDYEVHNATDSARVEVKGSTETITKIELTRNEVDSAKTYPYSILVLVSEIGLDRAGPTAQAGRPETRDPWSLSDADLTAERFSYRV